MLLLTKKYSTTTHHEARTLDPEILGNNDSEWIVRGGVITDHWSWINDFEAFHPDYGLVVGDFEEDIMYSSEKALAHFLKYHCFTEWDYRDI